MTELTVQQAFDLALQHHRAGRLGEAQQMYRQVLAQQPDHFPALRWLGVLAGQTGRYDVAADLLGRAAALRPADAALHSDLGNALLGTGRGEEAIAAYRRAIALAPAIAQIHYNLGLALKQQGRSDEAIAAYRQAVDLRPDFVEARTNLGNALADQGQLDAAIVAFRQVIALRSNFVEAHCNLGLALADQGQFDEAAAAYRRAIALKPDLADVHCNMGHVLLHQGQLDEALACYRRALAVRPDFHVAHSHLVGGLHFQPGCDAAALAQEHRHWNQVHAQPLAGEIRPHSNDRSPERRLRLGYVSADFRNHVVGRCLLPLFRQHDHERFEVFGYASVLRPDAITGTFEALSDQWRNLVGQSDAAVAQLIRQDRIDILVDLTLHMPGNRLLVFARKPAPVQVTYLAYCSTSGLGTMDYRLTDPRLDPPGVDESVYSERSVRLPETYWCYEPGVVTAPVSDLPAIGAGRVTFGCLNNFCKVTQPTLEAWASLLHRVAGSRLLLFCPPGSSRQRVQAFFSARDTNPQRIVFADRVPLPEYFQLYQQIDIALDPFPYGGGTTTCDALWMGVPVVSLVGQLPIARSGLTLLSQVGLSHLAVGSWQEYIDAAAGLAGDLAGLRQLRASLRERMRLAPLMDAPRFARHLEAAYRQMWHRWCNGEAR